jgi:hypothetical protein
MSRETHDLLALLIVTVSLMGLTVVLPWPGVAAGFAGFALLLTTAALAARAVLPGRVDALTRVVTMAALSIGTVILAGPFLNFLPKGMTRTNLTLFVGAVGLVSYIVACRRGGGRPLGIVRLSRPGLRPRDSLALVLCAALLVVAGSVALDAARNASREDFASLWLVPSPAPTTLAGQAPPINVPMATATVGVHNNESLRQAFTVEVFTGGVALSYHVVLPPGEQWERDVEVVAGQASARVYRGSRTTGEAYRSAWLGDRPTAWPVRAESE